LAAHVTLLDLSLDRLRYLSDVLPPNVDLLYSNRHNLLEQLRKADLVIGAVLLPGAKAPKLVRREDLKLMKPGSVIVDVAVDQGGCIETSRPTTHENPVYVVDGMIHYAVGNMPGGGAGTLERAGRLGTAAGWWIAIAVAVTAALMWRKRRQARTV